jgi:hypothetical protein
MTIDTLEYVKKLEAAGVDRRAGEAHAEALRAAIADELATKSDIQRLEAGTKADIQRLEARISEVRTELAAKIFDLKAEIMKYMVAQTFVIVGVMFALLRFVR